MYLNFIVLEIKLRAEYIPIFKDYFSGKNKTNVSEILRERLSSTSVLLPRLAKGYNKEVPITGTHCPTFFVPQLNFNTFPNNLVATVPKELLSMRSDRQGAFISYVAA